MGVGKLGPASYRDRPRCLPAHLIRLRATHPMVVVPPNPRSVRVARLASPEGPPELLTGMRMALYGHVFRERSGSISTSRTFFGVFFACLLWAPLAWSQPAAEDAPPTPVVIPQEAAAAPAKVVLTPEAKAQVSAVKRARAEGLVGEGTALYRNGLYAEAIDKFRTAYGLTEDVDLLYRIALCHQQLREWNQCVAVFERYLELAPNSPQRDRGRNTRDSCAARQLTDQRLSVTSTPSGASVYLENRKTGLRGQTPLNTAIAPGVHRVWVELDGYAPVMQDIEVQQGEPFNLNLVLKPRDDSGWLFVDASIREAKVFLDGEAIQLTPFVAPITVSAGPHQVIVERRGFTRITTQIDVQRARLTVVDAPLMLSDPPSTWRSSVGWTANVLGALSIAGGVVAWQFADDAYNDTAEFDTLAGYERMGYGVGGGLLALGLGLIIWDAVRAGVDPEDLNPAYGEQPPLPIGAKKTTAGEAAQ